MAGLKEIQGMMFDFDGVLGHTLGFWSIAVRQILNEYQVSDPGLFREVTDKEIMEEILPRFGNIRKFTRDSDALSQEQVNAFSRRLVARATQLGMAEENDPNSVYNPHAIPVLTELRKMGVVCAVVTSSEPEWIAFHLQKMALWENELLAHVDHRFSGGFSDHPETKPHPAPLQRIMNQYPFRPDQWGMVGDGFYIDVLAARNAGAQPFLVRNPETSLYHNYRLLRREIQRERMAEKQPLVVIRSLDQIPPLLR